jgi:cobalt/nickel transport protein
MDQADSTVNLEIEFWHPFANQGMSLPRPLSFAVYHSGEKNELVESLEEKKVGEFTTWRLAYKVDRPGLYTFVMAPHPYFEPAEDSFIIHFTKVYVDAFGDNEGWSEPTPGLKTEIVPLSAPGALYAGNVFTGKVLLDGQPVPGGEVEIEWRPGPDKKGQAPYESMITQVVKTDENGNFNFAPTAPGWWGFAGLNAADFKLPHEGLEKDVELGAVLWVYFHEFRPAVDAK